MKTEPWRPLANESTFKQRAGLYQQIRAFMADRDILEVDTPILSHAAVSDPYINSLTAHSSSRGQHTLFLQTSPEFCMKRLLAQGLGAIYQIAHVFRDEEAGAKHTTEFTLLEWYRPGFNYHQLMQETTELLRLLGINAPDKSSYAEAFISMLDLDPHTAETSELNGLVNKHGWETDSNDRHALLDYLFSTFVMPGLTPEPVFIYDYPLCMAALSTQSGEPASRSQRFELFINGMEIASGFNELTDVAEQTTRFENDLLMRESHGELMTPIDQNFLSALRAGMPKCAGIAMGLDRLLMTLAGKKTIHEVMSFTLENN